MFELHLSRDNKAKFYSHEGCYKVVDLCETKKKAVELSSYIPVSSRSLFT